MASAPAFRTDVTIRAPTSQNLLDRQSQQRIQSSAEYLDAAAESVNKQIDNDIKQMLDSFEALMSLSRIRDKDVFRIAQENFELEGRADAMVRSAQSLTLLSHSLKLSLLFSQESVGGSDGQSLDEEALSLIESTAKSKQTCAKLLEKMFDLGEKEATKANDTTKELEEKDTAEQKQNSGSAVAPNQKPPLDDDQTPEDLDMEEAA